MPGIERSLARLAVETPSWGYGDSGTRFAVFPQPGRPRDVFEKLQDAAEVHRLTGSAPAVALHFPWDQVEDFAALRDRLRELGLRVGAVNPNLFQDQDYRLGSLCNPDAGIRRKALDHLFECVQIATAPAPPRSRCGWRTAPTTRGRTTCARVAQRLQGALAQLYAALPAEQELLIEYKLFEPAFYATDIADWGSARAAVPAARRPRARARRSRPPRTGGQRRTDRVDPGGRAAGSGAFTSTIASTPMTI